MKKITINGSLRTELGKKATKSIRKKGNVPCIIYGGENITHFHAHENSFKNLVYSPDAFLVTIEIEGKPINAIMQEIQFHPVTDKILHIDFVEVIEGRPVIIHLPLNIFGDSPGVKAGGKLRIKRRNLKVKGLIKDMPEKLDVDISDVKLNHTIQVGDLNYPNIEILDPHRSMVLAVATSRISKADEEADALAAEAAAEAAEAAGETEGESTAAGESAE